MKASLTYLGRVLSLSPAGLGERFHDICTINATQQEAACAENGWKSRTIPDVSVLYWYDTDPNGVDVFCTTAGFGYRIYRELSADGYEVEVRDLVPSGLPERPDFSKLPPGISWRGSQKEVFAKLLANRCGVIDCPTGWGKSFLIRTITQVYPKSKIGVTVPSADVAKELYKELSLVEPGGIGFVGDGKSKRRRVTVAITHSLLRLDPDINLLLVDEVHAVLTKTFIAMFNKMRRARIQGFTATPAGRSDNGDGFLEAIFGPIIHYVPYQEAVASGNVVQLRYRVYQSIWGPPTTAIKSKPKRDRQGIWRNPSRNALIVDAVRAAEDEIGPDGQILIMVSTAEHAYLLKKHLQDYVVVHGPLSDERHEALVDAGVLGEGDHVITKDEKSQAKADFESGKVRRAIATYVWSKGVNFLDLNVLVRADGTASPIQSGQIPGRLSRKGSDGTKAPGIVIDFNDSFCPIMAKRSKERFAVYERNGWAYEPGVIR